MKSRAVYTTTFSTKKRNTSDAVSVRLSVYTTTAFRDPENLLKTGLKVQAFENDTVLVSV